MQNKFIKKYDSKLAEELRKESAGAMSLNWQDSYRDTKYSIERIERLGEYADDKNTPSGIGWFVFLIVVLSMFYVAFIGSFHFQARKMVLYAIIGVAIVIGLCFLGRFLFYRAIERRLIFAENRRLTHENRYPGISNLVLDYLEKESDEIPPRIEPAVSMMVVNPDAADEDFEVKFDREEINRQIDESLKTPVEDQFNKVVVESDETVGPLINGEADEIDQVGEISDRLSIFGIDEDDDEEEDDDEDDESEETVVESYDRELFTGTKTIVVMYPQKLREALDESLKILKNRK